MCQICDTNAELYGEIVPDWFVYRAVTDGHETGKLAVDAGEWFIAMKNSGQAAFNWTNKTERVFAGKEYNGDFVTCCPGDGYFLAKSCEKVGFKPGEENFHWWFVKRLREFRKTHKEPIERKEHDND